MSMWGRTAFTAGLMGIVLHGTAAHAQNDGTAGAPPSGAYFPPAMVSPAPAPGAAPVNTTLAAPVASPPVTAPPPQWVQGNSPSASGSPTCSMTANLVSSWSMSLTADQAAPTIFTLAISGPYTFPSDGAQRVALYYDRGFQAFTGTTSGNSISIPLDASSFPQFLHGFTAGRSMLIAEGEHPAYSVNLAGSSAAVAALGQCTEAEGFTQLPPPWHAAPVVAASNTDQANTNASPSADAAPANTDAQQTTDTTSAPIATAQASEPTSSSPTEAPAQDTTSTNTSSGGDSGGGTASFLALVVLFIGGMVAWRIAARIKRRKEEEARDLDEMRRRHSAQKLIEDEINQQATRLGIRRSQLVFTDFYGTPDLGKWQREMEQFCATRLVPQLEREGLGYLWPEFAMDTLRMIDRAALSNSQAPSVAPGFVSNPAVFDPRMDPLDYERHCALLLRDAGWDATLTPATGDQGADVIAEKAGVRLVVQCKLYSQAVGNDAVQQTFAAKNFQRAQMAAVVSNAPFTSAARQIAMTTGVFLMHHEELRTLKVENVYGRAAGLDF